MNITIEQALQQAVEAHKAGKLRDAELLYRAILQAQPRHPNANHNLGVLAVSLNKAGAALSLLKTALEANPDNGLYWISYVDALIKEGQLESAKQVLEQGKKRGLTGDSVNALTRRLTHSGADQESAPLEVGQANPIEKEINDLLERYHEGQYDLVQRTARSLIQKFPNHQLTWKILGAALKQAGKLDEALAANEEAVRLVPNDAETYNNLGVTLRELGRLEEAEASYGKAIALEPGYVEAHNNRGANLRELGRLHDAEMSYRKAIALKPDYAEAHSNLGNVLKELGGLEDAKACYRTAIELKPNLVEVHSNLGLCLLEDNDFTAALDSVIRAIRIKPSVATKSVFVETIRKLSPQSWEPALAEMVKAALLEPWARPSEMSSFASNLIKANPVFLQFLERFGSGNNQDRKDDVSISSFTKGGFEFSPLLHALLSSGPIADDELEKFLTRLRAQLLKAAMLAAPGSEEGGKALPLQCSLAQQCFVNEYVYFQTPEEINDSEHLRDRLTKALKNDEVIPSDWVTVVACYFPLYSVSGSEKLLQQNWPDDVMAVLKQQIQEHLAEMKLRASIPNVTGIDNHVSLAVQSQYEENPYPRWVRLPQEKARKFLNTYIRNLFPTANFRPLADDKNPEMLIAGCGTGQHSIETAQSLEGARILAVDLSAASLAYAKRKTKELNIESIEYAQADLLKLASLDRTFDAIESSGVLHHLEDPFEGWRVLLSLLRPNGLMRLGFYSELGRRDIVRVRNLIGQEGARLSAQDIRNFRKHLGGLKGTEDYGFAVRSSDFFSTSACRDLLFHIQEHRTNLDVINAFLKCHDLNFLGFELDRSLKRAYLRRFPNDPSATNLDYWYIYEEENPDTFIAMYQFWVQKRQ